MALFTGVQYLYTCNIVAPLSPFTNCLEGVVHHQPVHLCWCSLLTTAYHGKVYFLCCTASLVVVLSLWRRDRNRMDSYRVSTVDIPESSIASDARALWQQQSCVSSALSWRMWGFTPSSVVVFFWALNEGGAARTCSNRQNIPSA